MRTINSFHRIGKRSVMTERTFDLRSLDANFIMGIDKLLANAAKKLDAKEIP
jgi:hypothetical protein